MKKLRVFGLVAILIGVFLAPVNAQGPPGSWTTDFTVLNLKDQEATVEIKRFAECEPPCTADTGTVITTTVIPANGSFYYNPILDPAFPATFGGSVVMSSNQPLAATVTVGNDKSGSSQYASDAYSGISEVSDSVFLPIIMGNLGVWNTRIAVQNAGSATADVTIHYIGTGAPADTVISALPPNMVALVDQQENAGMTNFNGSALVTSSQPLAIVVDEYKSSGGVLVSYIGVPSTDADTTVYMPGYIAQGVWQTDFTIVNTTANTATVSLAFSGATNVLSGTVPPNGSAYVNAFIGVYPDGWTGTAPTVGYYGAATVTSNEDIVIVYNEANSGTGGAGNFALGYVGFPSAAGSMNVAMPLVMYQYSTGWDTTFSVQVIGGGVANLTLSYADITGSKTAVITDSYTFNPSQSGNQAYGHVPTGYIGGVTVTSDKNIVVIGDQNLTGGVGDTSAGFPGLSMQ